MVILYEAQLCALHVLVLLNTVNYSTVVDQSDYSISNIIILKALCHDIRANCLLMTRPRGK